VTSGDDYVDHLLDLFSSAASCRARKMFGGWGLFFKAI